MKAESKKNRMLIPKPRGENIYWLVITSIILGLCAIGIINIVNWVAIIPSCIWLGLVLLMIYAAGKEYGTFGFIRNIMGAFASRHFVDNCEGKLCFGFTFAGINFFYIKLPVEKIASVDWRTGQGTYLAGRDMNDWQVALWYDHDDPGKTEERTKWKFKNPEQELYLVGPSGRKEIIAAFGDSLILFLNKAGAKLIPGEDECKFIRNISKRD